MNEYTVKYIVKIDKEAAREALTKLAENIDDMNVFMMKQMFITDKKYRRNPSIKTLTDLFTIAVMQLIFEEED